MSLPAPLPSTHPELTRLFEHFPGQDIAVVGSALRDYDTAGDIDVLVPASVDLPALAKHRKAKYSGWDLKDGSHLRQVTLRLPGVSKRVQVVQNTTVKQFADWPHEVLLRDGRRLNPGKHYRKDDPRDPARVGAKPRPSRRTADVYRGYA